MIISSRCWRIRRKLAPITDESLIVYMMIHIIFKIRSARPDGHSTISLIFIIHLSWPCHRYAASRFPIALIRVFLITGLKTSILQFFSNIHYSLLSQLLLCHSKIPQPFPILLLLIILTPHMCTTLYSKVDRYFFPEDTSVLFSSSIVAPFNTYRLTRFVLCALLVSGCIWNETTFTRKYLQRFI
jgi:hypothetical protein